MANQNNMALNDKSQLTIDVKSLVGVVLTLLTISGVYFTLTGSLAALQLDVIRMQDSVEMNEEFRIKWPRGEMGTLPADSEQYMLIEDIYGSVEKIEKQLDSMMDNKINIQFLQKQVEKMLSDIEKLKDADREIVYQNGNGTH